MKYVSVDIETTGVNPYMCQVIEIGAVVDDLREQRPIEELPKFHCYVVHPIFQGEPFALSMHPAIFKRIAKREVGYDYYEPGQVPEIFHGWLCHHYPGYPDQEKVNFAGKNFAAFDLQFLNRLPGWDDWVKYRHRILDPGMLLLRAGDTALPDSSECRKRIGESRGVTHTAVPDAMDVVKMLRKGWEKIIK